MNKISVLSTRLLFLHQVQQQAAMCTRVTSIKCGSTLQFTRVGGITACNEQGSRRYVSKAAAAKFGKRIKKGTFNRYLGLDPTRWQHGFEEIKELEDASETVRRLFSLECAPGSEIKKVFEADTFAGVEHDPTDEGYTNYLVTSIAKLTVGIRNLAPHVDRFPRDKKNKRIMILMTDRRHKHIKFLRRTNYDVALRLQDQLKVEYVPVPLKANRQTKKHLEKKAVCLEAFQARQIALMAFRDERMVEQLREIAEIKTSLGMGLTDEERTRMES